MPATSIERRVQETTRRNNRWALQTFSEGEIFLFLDAFHFVKEKQNNKKLNIPVCYKIESKLTFRTKHNEATGRNERGEKP